MRDFPRYKDHLYCLPTGIKVRLLELVTKRGLLDEHNMLSVLNLPAS